MFARSNGCQGHQLLNSFGRQPYTLLAVVQSRSLFLWLENYSFVLPGCNIVQSVFEVSLAALDTRRILLICVQVGMDQLNEPIDVSSSNLRL